MLPIIVLTTLFISFNLTNALPQVQPQPEPADANLDNDPPGVLIGDLATTGPTTPVGQSIANVLLGNEAGLSSYTLPPPSKGGISGCKSSTDPCCIWYSVAADLTTAFKGPTGRCNDMARAAIRLGFHDAGTWSSKLAAAGQDFGGADGSFVLFNEITRAENRGLELITLFAMTMRAKYKSSGVNLGDLIQFMATHAVVTCPLGPRVRTFIGRKDATKASPDGLLPSVTSNADTLINLFADKTISAHELAALLGAHSTSQQFATKPSAFGQPQDTTPGIWDVSFYNETLYPPAPGVMQFASDKVLSNDSRIADEWHAFIGDQGHWIEDYARAYVRLSLLGVNNINGLVECTKVLPAATPSFAKGNAVGVTEKRKGKRSLKSARSVIKQEALKGGCTGFKAE